MAISSYSEFWKKIVETEEKLKPAKSQNFKKLNDYAKNKLLVKVDPEAVEEFKNLKENVTEGSLAGFSVAYQPVIAENTKWNQQDR